jgi:hypothetical protein
LQGFPVDIEKYNTSFTHKIQKKKTCKVSSAAISSSASMSVVILENTKSNIVFIHLLYVEVAMHGSHIIRTFSRLKTILKKKRLDIKQTDLLQYYFAT